MIDDILKIKNILNMLRNNRAVSYDLDYFKLVHILFVNFRMLWSRVWC